MKERWQMSKEYINRMRKDFIDDFTIFDLHRTKSIDFCFKKTVILV